ncbi:hypothetical protein [Plantactinospora sp. WMMB782]|uniref:hypothetical protein n=1 Tax=Plantactinospora sp. WMMB782 TaxID=3404121 RepID=UPI003B95CC75
MRDQLRDLIAAKMHADDCGCDGPEDDFYRNLADSVMELFPDVERQGRDAAGGWDAAEGWEPLATRWVARTAPEETPR